MKKTFGLLALLAASAAVTVPAMAKDRNDRNNFSETRTTYVVDRNHDRNDHFGDRDHDNARRVIVRRDTFRNHDNRFNNRSDNRYAIRYDDPRCR